MQTIETGDFKEARRCRRVQYSGLATAITLNGSNYRGNVFAVKEVGSAENRRWVVKFVPKQDKPTVARQERHKPAYL